MVDFDKILVFSSVYFNVFLALGNRLSQIIYFCVTTFINQNISNTCLAFILILPLSNIFMISIYLFSQNDLNITIKQKIKYFFFYIFSAEVAFSIGVHISFKSKFSHLADNILITKKVLNAMHIIFISLPQLLIVTIHSSSLGTYKAIDIISLVFSCGFIMWSIAYYILCTVKETEYDIELEEIVN